MTDQFWKIWQNAKLVQQLCLKESNCPGGTSGVLLPLNLYCQRITILTDYTNIWFVLNEIRVLFL